MDSEQLNPNAHGEERALLFSLVGSVGALLLAFSFAMITRSGAIMLDGFYSLVTVSMSFVTLKVAALMKVGRSPKFQFGYYGFDLYFAASRLEGDALGHFSHHKPLVVSVGNVDL